MNQVGMVTKINSRCEFGETLDLDEVLKETDSFLLSQ